MNREGQCRWPKPRVIPVPTEVDRTYTPHCTILHRCGADTGCCNSDSQMCVAKHKESVDLYFIVTTLGHDQETYEKHTFENHTECECVDRRVALRNSQVDLEPNPLLSCDCPSEYRGEIGPDGSCQCDCDAYNQMCRELKYGLQSFAINDRL